MNYGNVQGQFGTVSSLGQLSKKVKWAAEMRMWSHFNDPVVELGRLWEKAKAWVQLQL